MNLNIAFRGYLQDEEKLAQELEEEVEFVRKQLNSMGRIGSLQRITAHITDNFGIDEITEEKIRYKAMADGLSKADEIIEKFAILEFLVGDELIQCIRAQKENYFKDTIFAQYFESMSLDHILDKYSYYIKKYEMRIHELINHEIERIPRYSSPELDGAPSRLQTMPFKLKAEKAIFLATEAPRIKLIFDRKTDRFERRILTQLYCMQIHQNIYEKLKKGLDQSKELYALKVLENPKEKQRINMPELNDIIEALISEANSQLQLFKLPKRFSKYLSTLTELHKTELATSIKKSYISRRLDLESIKIGMEIAPSKRMSLQEYEHKLFDLRTELSQLL